jgi:hypothetical protein
LRNWRNAATLVTCSSYFGWPIGIAQRAAKAIIDALPHLQDGTIRYAALQSLATLTHHESNYKDFDAKVRQWQEWWAKPQKKEIYKPRDWRVPLSSLN